MQHVLVNRNLLDGLRREELAPPGAPVLVGGGRERGILPGASEAVSEDSGASRELLVT